MTAQLPPAAAAYVRTVNDRDLAGFIALFAGVQPKAPGGSDCN